MKKIKIGLPWYFIWMKRLFKLAEIVCPPLANFWALKFFTTPIKFPYPASEKPLYHTAKKQAIDYNGVKVMTYAWGNPNHPVVVLMHGWSSRTTQFRYIIEKLMANQFYVVGLDAPAHGKSEGKETDLFGFAGALKLVCKNQKEVHAIIGHSLGGVAATLNVKNGLRVKKLVVMGSPAIAEDILHNFVERINAYESRAVYIKKRMKEIYHIAFEDVTAKSIVVNFPLVDTLLVYDKHDKEAPIHHGELLHKAISTSTLFTTSGLGHTKMLKDVTVTQAVADFLKT